VILSLFLRHSSWNGNNFTDLAHRPKAPSDPPARKWQLEGGSPMGEMNI
jgi:hypothetical protein